MKAPSRNGSNGRDTSGRFAPGCRGGPGNPHAQRTAQLRSVLLEAVTEFDLRAIVGKLVELAKGGDVAAAREVLNRTIGKADMAKDPDSVEVGALQLARLTPAERRNRCKLVVPPADRFYAGHHGPVPLDADDLDDSATAKCLEDPNGR